MRRAIFLDRDGTLIVDRIYLNDPQQIEFLPGAFDGLRQLRDAGYIFIVATNQSGIPRGFVQLKNLHMIHDIVRAEFCRSGVDILHFYYAPFMTDSNHPMRKPSPGMLLEAAFDFNIDLKQSWMIGDRITDVEAGDRAGCRTILLKGTEDLSKMESRVQPTAITSDLIEAAQFITMTTVSK
jgi:D-glycero-D-manno-heptose 1,7-bisphosphate phosphatase